MPSKGVEGVEPGKGALRYAWWARAGHSTAGVDVCAQAARRLRVQWGEDGRRLDLAWEEESCDPVVVVRFRAPVALWTGPDGEVVAVDIFEVCEQADGFLSAYGPGAQAPGISWDADARWLWLWVAGEHGDGGGRRQIRTASVTLAFCQNLAAVTLELAGSGDAEPPRQGVDVGAVGR